jgi:hypothetical protein
MPFDLSLPLFAAFGLALGAVVTYFGWPHIRIRTYNKTHGDLRVVELALILSRPARARQFSLGETERPPAGAEFVIYMTLKSGNL